MKSLRESLLDSEEILINNIDEDVVFKFIEDNFSGEFDIEDKNKEGKYEVFGWDIKVTNNKLTEITNGMFVWVEADSFDYGKCKVTSLKDMPKCDNINAEYLNIKFDNQEIAKIKKDLKEIWKKRKNEFDWESDGGEEQGTIKQDNYEIKTGWIWIDDMICQEYGDTDDWDFNDFAAHSNETIELDDPEIRTVTYCGVKLDEKIWKSILKY